MSKSLTPEEVLRLIRDLAKANAAAIAETNATIAANAAANAAAHAQFQKNMDDLGKKISDLGEKIDKTNEGLDKVSKKLTETVEGLARAERMLDKLTLDYGNRGNDEGFAFERAVWSTLDDNKEIGGIKLDEVIFNASGGKGKFQYDIVCLNGAKTVVVETKLTLSEEHVETFAANRLPHFAKLLPTYAKGKKVIGAMVYQRTDPKGAAVAAALKRGLLVLHADNQKHLHQVKTLKDLKEHP